MVHHGRHLAGRKKKPSASTRKTVLADLLSEEGRRELRVGITLIVVERLIDWMIRLFARWLGTGT